MAYLYLATPYSKFPGGTEKAYNAALDILTKFTRRDITCYSPIVQTHPVDLLLRHEQGVELTHKTWLDLDFQMIERSSGLVVVMLPGWAESKGVRAEIDFAYNRHIPVFFQEPDEPVAPVIVNYYRRIATTVLPQPNPRQHPETSDPMGFDVCGQHPPEGFTKTKDWVDTVLTPQAAGFARAVRAVDETVAEGFKPPEAYGKADTSLAAAQADMNAVTKRVFATGATRNQDAGKADYEGFLSPLVMEAYGEYMAFNSLMEDGTRRESDNWQKGIPRDSYMKSGFRHLMTWWRCHRGLGAKEHIIFALCGVIFNASGYLHEVMRHGPKALEHALEVAKKERGR